MSRPIYVILQTGNKGNKLTLLVVCDQSLGECLSDSVDLSDATTSLDPDPDVDIGEAILAQKQNWFLELVLESLGLNLVNIIS